MKNRCTMMSKEEDIAVKRKETMMIETTKEKGSIMNGIIQEIGTGRESIRDKEIIRMRGRDLENKIEIENGLKRIIRIIMIQKNQNMLINMIRDRVNILNMKLSLN